MALFAQDPGNGVHNVGFAAAVGPDDARQPAAAERDLVFSQNDLKPTNSTLRSLSKISPLWPPPSYAGSFQITVASAETCSDSWEGGELRQNH